MNFELSAEQQLLRDTLRRFAAERASITDHVRPMLHDERGCDPGTWNGLAELGVLGLLEPGSVDRDMISAGVAAEELGRALLPEPFLASAIAAMSALESSDATGLAADMASGARIATVAIYEPTRRYEWADPGVTARRRGARWQLSGTKCSVLGGGAADTFLVSARGEDDTNLFVVDRADLRDDSITMRPITDGTRQLAELTLDATPAVALAPGDGLSRLDRVVDHLAVGLAADALGAATAALERTVEYARHREQFGVPIGSFQAVQHLCADMVRDIEIARAGVYYALWACRSAGPQERRRATLMAKAYTSDVLPGVGEAAIQVFGGVGFTWENDIHLFYKRMLSAASIAGNAGQEYGELAELILPPVS